MTEPDDGMKPVIIGHILIRDPETGEVLLKQRDNFVHQPPIGNNNAPD